MNWDVVSESELSSIVGGEYITAASIMALMSILAILVACFKMYNSSKGKATLGPNYSFEWSWAWLRILIYPIDLERRW